MSGKELSHILKVAGRVLCVIVAIETALYLGLKYLGAM